MKLEKTQTTTYITKTGPNDLYQSSISRADPEVGVTASLGFSRNSGTDHPQEAIGPLESYYFSREVNTALC